MKLSLIIFLTTFFTLPVFAFTLITNVGAKFEETEVKVHVTSNSTCDNIGITPNEILDMVDSGMRQFWNTVPTSYLKIKAGSLYTTTDANFITGELCSTQSSNSCQTTNIIPKVTDIVIACNQNETENFTDNRIYSLTLPNNLDDTRIKGSVILLNDTVSTPLASFTKSEITNIIAHEIGHAIGIGHSDDTAALMYYAYNENQELLGQDDIDAITYLYPNKLHGCSSILSIEEIDDIEKGSLLPSLFSLLFGFFCIYAFRKLLPRLAHSAS